MNGDLITQETRRDSSKQVDRKTLYKYILDALKGGGEYTAHEVAVILYNDNKINSRSRQSVAPRLTELKHKGKVDVVGKRFDKLTERKVAVYRLAVLR
jgi:hypothetical protein